MGINMKIEVDKCALLNIVVNYEEEAKDRGVRLHYHFPTFFYVFDTKHHYLENDM